MALRPTQSSGVAGAGAAAQSRERTPFTERKAELAVGARTLFRRSPWPSQDQRSSGPSAVSCPPVHFLLILFSTNRFCVPSYNTYLCSLSSTCWRSLFLSVKVRRNPSPWTMMPPVHPGLCGSSGTPGICSAVLETHRLGQKTRSWGQTEDSQGFSPLNLLYTWYGYL